MGERATLLYGLGAPKTGTSWLYAYLSGHPDCALPPVKEVHFFDAGIAGGVDWQQDHLVRQIGGLRDRLARVEAGEAAGRPANIRRRIAAMERLLAVQVIGMRDPRAYLDFIYAGAGEAKLVADITPSYCLVPQARLREMAALVPQTRFLFIMRDPVDRIWSQCRFDAVNRAARDPELQPEAAAGFAVDRVLRGEAPEVMARSDYAAVIKKLSVLAPEQVMILFYEDLFTQDTLDGLCAFLGIAPRAGAFDVPRNRSPQMPLSDERRAGLQRMLAPQYAAAQDRMGALPEPWQRNMERV